MRTRRVRALCLLATLVVGGRLAACAYPDFRDHRSNADVSASAPESVPVPALTDPELAVVESLPLLRLRGDGYARGLLYGRAMAPAWQRAARLMDEHAEELVGEFVPSRGPARAVIHVASAHLAQRFCGTSSFRAEEYFPPEYRAYVQGIADGAGLGSERILRLIAYVMVSDASCSGFVAFGPATEDGRLLQLRSLDWGTEALPAQEMAVLLLHEPPGAQRYLSIGFVGLVGTITGINESGLSLTEIGADSRDWKADGLPMPLLLERVLAEARTLDEAVAILEDAPGTGGYNYLIGSARERRGAVVEKTARHVAVFEIGCGNYRDSEHYVGFEGFDARASAAADPVIRSFQNAANGPDPSPAGHPAYEGRYRRQIDLFESWGRRLDLPRSEVLAREVAPGDNLQSVIYDFDRGRVYVRYRAWFRDRREPTDDERERLRAALQPAAVVDLGELFRAR